MLKEKRSYGLIVLTRFSAVLLLILVNGSFSSCQHFSSRHSVYRQEAIEQWSERVEKNGLVMRFTWARPRGEGPYPVVLVHPEAWSKSAQMGWLLRELAGEGYMAAAVDYHREPVKGQGKSTFFVWRGQEDVRAAVEHVLTKPHIDQSRLALLGFSQGAMYSLLIAAYTDEADAVVAFYPIADVDAWLNDDENRNWALRQVYKLVRHFFRIQSGAGSEEEYLEKLREGSPLHQVDNIRAPVLLLHGDADTRVNIGQSRSLEKALKIKGGEVRLIEVRGGKHGFQIDEDDQAKVIWQEVLDWLDRQLN